MSGEVNAFRRTQAQQERNRRNAQAVATRPQVLSGQVQVSGAGDTLVNLPFPVQFSQKPLLAFGFDLEHGQDIVIGSLPTLTMGVVRWDIVGNPPEQLFYRGCTLAIVTTGAANQIMYAHYHFTGTAMSNPVSASTSLEAPI